MGECLGLAPTGCTTACGEVVADGGHSVLKAIHAGHYVGLDLGLAILQPLQGCEDGLRDFVGNRRSPLSKV